MKPNDEEKNQDPLDANLAKLINKENLPPAPSEEQKKAMLDRLWEKQGKLEPAPGTKTRSPIPVYQVALIGLAAAVIALLCATFFFPSSSVPPLSITTPELGPSDPAPESPRGDLPEELVTEARAYHALEGTRRIALRDGSTAIAQKGTRFVELAPRRLKLEVGSLYLLVAKAATPLEVVTPQGKVLAFGTRFLVSSKSTDTRVAVAQGKVQLIGASGDQHLNLVRGEEGLIALTELTRRPAPRLSHLVGWARESLQEPELAEIAGIPRRGMIAIDPQGQESRLSLRQYTLDVVIENGVARTTMDQTFFNHYHANTEGIFYFPLPPGAAVSRMAMYVNGKRNEAGMVERKRGQKIYNEIKYANRDPALLEQLEGNLYKLRIFPLEGRQEKRIFISFTQTVDELYRTLRYWFPMDHTQNNAGKVSIHLRIKGGAKIYDPESSTHQFTTKIDGEDLVLHYEAANLKPDQDLMLKLIPKVKSKRVADTATLSRKGMNYLHTRIRLELEGKVDPRPRQWFVLNDTSGSRSSADLKAQAHIIARLIAEADDQDQIALANLNIDLERLTHGLVPLRGEAAKKALAKMRAAPRIGGTNLGEGLASIRAWITTSGAENPHIVYLGDGLATDGRKTSRELTTLLDKEIPFIGLAVGKKADLSFLRSAANATGGVALFMNSDEDLNWRVFDMLASFNTPRLSDLHWEFPGAPEGISAYGDRATLSAGEALTIVVATEKKLPAELTLRGKLNGEPWEQVIALEAARDDAGFIPRFWAQRHLEELLKEGEKHREEIVRLSMKHYVATPFTSLIVLENDQMYAKYEVEKGRQDHWAPYPAPERIPVVREPVPWYTHHFEPSHDNKLTIDPKSAEEIIETLLPKFSGGSVSPAFIYAGRFGNGNPSLWNRRNWGWVGSGVFYDGQVAPFQYFFDASPTNWNLSDVFLNYSLGIGDGGGGGVRFRTDLRGYVGASYRSVQWGALPGVGIPGLGFGLGISRGATAIELSIGGGEMAFAGMVSDANTISSFGSYEADRNGDGLDGRGDFWYVPGRFLEDGATVNWGRGRGWPVNYLLVGNLTTVIPALTTTSSDHASAVEMKLGREKQGSITDEAAVLVRAAQAKRKSVRIDGAIITPDGRMKHSITSPMYLKEEATSDGKNWHHIYRELGLATRRPVTPSILAAIQSGVPHWPPTFNELEAHWVVILGAKDEQWFEIILVAPDDQDRKRILKISRQGRLLESRHYKGGKLQNTLRFRYEGNIVIIKNGSRLVQRYEAVEIEVADALFVAELDELVVLDLPLRKPAYYQKQLAALDEDNIEEQKTLLRHLITSRLRDTRPQYFAQGIAAAHKEWARLILLGAGSTPLFDHRTLSVALIPQTPTLKQSAFLNHFKDVTALSAVRSPNREQVEKFIQDWPESPMLLTLVQRCPDSKVWIPLLDLPNYQSAAIEHISGAAPGQSWPDRAALATRIAELLIAGAQEEKPAVISKQVASFLTRDFGGPQRDHWARLVEAYQKIAKDLAKLDPGAVVALLDLAIREKDGDLETRCLSHLLKALEEAETAQEILVIADLFSRHQRHEKATELYKKALAEVENPSAAVLQKASAAVQPVDENLSISWQRRALRKLGEENAAANSKLLVQSYSALLSRALAAKDLETAKEVAIEGYELLSAQHSLITAIATHFHEEGNDTERWRWLSTIIDRNPKSADASGSIGSWYDQRSLLMEANAMFVEAHASDSAHPQWLIKRASVLYRAGKFEEADELYRELIKTDWAHQLKRLVPSEFRLYLSDPGEMGRITQDDPGAGWNGVDFDDSTWKERAGRFGHEHAEDPIWKAPFHMRQKFHVARTPRRVDLQASVHGVACDVYINGILVHHLEEGGSKANGAGKPYTVTLPKRVLDSLVIGENVIALRCKKIGKWPLAYVELMQIHAKPQ